MKLIFLVIILLIDGLSFISNVAEAQDSIENHKTIYFDLAQETLPIYRVQESLEKESSSDNDLSFLKLISDSGKLEFPKPLESLDLKKRYLTIFDSICKKDKHYQDILSKNLLTDIELFKGGLFEKINRTLTDAGTVYLSKIIYTPTTKIEKLKKRQEIIKKFIENEYEFNRIKDMLSTFGKSEGVFANFSNFNEFKNSKVYEAFYELGFISKIIPGAGALISRVQKNPTYMALDRPAKKFHALFYYSLTLMPLLMYIGSRNEFLSSLIMKIMNFNKKDQIIENIIKQIIFIPSAFMASVIYYFILKNEKAGLIEMKNMLIKVKEIIRSIDIINYQCKKISGLKSYFKSLNNLDLIINNSNGKHKDLEDIYKILRSQTFNEFSENEEFDIGKITVAYKLVYEIFQQIREALLIIGKIDAYCSIATLYKESLNKKSKYCFVEYSANRLPYINVKDFYHPLINYEKVVLNSIELGVQGFHRNAVITGPNAGGKSTTLKSLVTLLLFAQTLGIAPAASAFITPFDKIISYMNIVDNMVNGDSLFLVEVNRALELEKTLASGAKTFIISDEMLTGTDPVEGSAATYSIAKSFSHYENGMILIATHFPLLTKLEKDTNGIYKNYRVKVNPIENGKIDYPYVLEEGIANQKIAIDILRIKGVNTKILQEAESILNDIQENNTNIFIVPKENDVSVTEKSVLSNL